MLDRKTKSIDASVELLEDRLKFNKILDWIYSTMLIITALLVLLCMVAWRITEEIDVLVALGLAIFVCLLSLGVLIEVGNRGRNLNLLIFFKKQQEIKNDK